MTRRCESFLLCYFCSGAFSLAAILFFFLRLTEITTIKAIIPHTSAKGKSHTIAIKSSPTTFPNTTNVFFTAFPRREINVTSDSSVYSITSQRLIVAYE